MIRPSATGVEIDIRVVVRAQKTVLGGTREGCLVVRLQAPPVEGAANEALLRFLAELLHVPRRAVRLVKGERSRTKRVAVDAVAREDVERCLDG
jgi:uncharacterized protein (TIGR00251 family)